MDISKSSVELPDPKLPVGREGRVVVKLADVNGRKILTNKPIPNITSAVILPSGTRQALQVSSSESDSSKLVVLFSPGEPGTITLELSSHGVFFRSRFPVSPGIFFDPRKCHRPIVLSNNNRVATRGPGAAANYAVLASDGYLSGCHKWSVRVIKGVFGNYGILIGVTSAPSDGNHDSTKPFFGEKATGRRSWSAHGKAHKYQASHPYYIRDKPGDMRKVIDGDVLVFTLDCDVGSLQCLNHRTQEAKEITGIDCSQTLYPGVCLYKEGHSVEILPYH